ncbi:hypothetical protein CCACVL1_28353 [Corchorus capsularis]|uniref:Uncharacterized protein n=1 Tax=Corchorus capsularis TaxID=210143 RepID=A0A1R3G6Z1_COCAP|nr:hypothetical protein CCACVL1_28353 [Corchorus capsularis]
MTPTGAANATVRSGPDESPYPIDM